MVPRSGSVECGTSAPSKFFSTKSHPNRKCHANDHLTHATKNHACNEPLIKPTRAPAGPQIPGRVRHPLHPPFALDRGRAAKPGWVEPTMVEGWRLSILRRAHRSILRWALPVGPMRSAVSRRCSTVVPEFHGKRPSKATCERRHAMCLMRAIDRHIPARHGGGHRSRVPTNLVLQQRAVEVGRR